MKNDPNFNRTPMPFAAWGTLGEGNANSTLQQHVPGKNQIQTPLQRLFDQSGNQHQLSQQRAGRQQQQSLDISHGAFSVSSRCLSPVDKKRNPMDPTYVVGGNGGGGNDDLDGIFNPDSTPTSPGGNSSGADSPEGSQQRQTIRRRGRVKAKTFPEKLLDAMLEYTDETAFAWLPDEKSFVVVNPDRFCNHVLKTAFKEAKYASFIRKVHRWGFVRLTSGAGMFNAMHCL